MLRTAVCELLGIKVPIVQAAIWPATSPELVAAVCEAWRLRSVGAVFESAESVERDGPRAAAHPSALRGQPCRAGVGGEVFPRYPRGGSPKVISFALGNPGDLVGRAREAGVKAVHQVHTVAQAREAADLGVDAIIAQGAEAGGQGMALGVSTMAPRPSR